MLSIAEERRRSHRVTFAAADEQANQAASNQQVPENENMPNAAPTNVPENQNRELILNDTTNTCELEVSTELADRFQVHETIPFDLIQKAYSGRNIVREKFLFRIHIDERENKCDTNGSLGFLSIKLEKYVPPPEGLSSSSETNRSEENVHEDIEEDYEDPANDAQENNQNNDLRDTFGTGPNDLNIEAVRMGLARGDILIESESSDEGVELPTLYQEQYETN